MKQAILKVGEHELHISYREVEEPLVDDSKENLMAESWAAETDEYQTVWPPEK